MPSVYDLKPRFQAILRPAMRALARAGSRPNGVTIVALLGSILVGVALTRAARQPALLLLLPLWLFIRMALNAIDGMMARELNMATQLGAVLNELGDVLSDLALYLPLALFFEPALWAVIAFTFGALLTEFCGILGSALGAGRHYEGPMGKSDRAFVAGLLGILTWSAPALASWWPYIFWAAAALTALTCWNRISRTLRR